MQQVGISLCLSRSHSCGPSPFRGVCVLHAPSSTSPQRLWDVITSVAGEALEDNGGFGDVSSLFGSELWEDRCPVLITTLYVVHNGLIAKSLGFLMPETEKVVFGCREMMMHIGFLVYFKVVHSEPCVCSPCLGAPPSCYPDFESLESNSYALLIFV